MRPVFPKRECKDTAFCLSHKTFSDFFGTFFRSFGEMLHQIAKVQHVGDEYFFAIFFDYFLLAVIFHPKKPD